MLETGGAMIKAALERKHNFMLICILLELTKSANRRTRFKKCSDTCNICPCTTVYPDVASAPLYNFLFFLVPGFTGFPGKWMKN